MAGDAKYDNGNAIRWERMMENSAIQWTDHTLNFWWGCFKISPGCANCYAETFSKRVGRNIWGPPKTTERWRTKGPWRDVFKWDAKAKAEGVRRKVFCQSMSDFFEDHPQLEPWRAEALEIIGSLEWLDIQLLTKRPENIATMVPESWMERWPDHIWVGTSAENQETADQRIPELLKIPAAIHFLSAEPLLGPIELTNASREPYFRRSYLEYNQRVVDGQFREETYNKLNWVIIGGESGAKARPFDLSWARNIVAQCRKGGVAPFVKQLGSYPIGDWGDEKKRPFFAQRWFLNDKKGGDWSEWPEDLRVREFPKTAS